MPRSPLSLGRPVFLTELSRDLDGENHPRPEYRNISVFPLQGGDRGVVEVGDRVEGFPGLDFVMNYRGFCLCGLEVFDLGRLGCRRLAAGGFGFRGRALLSLGRSHFFAAVTGRYRQVQREYPSSGKAVSAEAVPTAKLLR